MRQLTVLLFILIATSYDAPVRAAVVLDQHHPWYQPAAPLAIGGKTEQRVAQTFRARRSGNLHHLELMWGCAPASPGLLTVELQGTDSDGHPDGHVLAAVARESASYAGDLATMRQISFGDLAIDAGVSYAIVIRAERESQCSMPGGGAFLVGYDRGDAWIDARPNPPGWIALSSWGDDILFYVFLSVREPTGPRWCEFDDASGIPNDWLPNDVPICACLSEPSLRVSRCWFAFPGFVAWRELHWGDDAGFANWGITPIDPKLGAMSIRERGIDAGLDVDPVSVPGQLPPGSPSHFDVGAQGTAKRSHVDFVIQREGSDSPLKARFETRIDIPGE